MRRRTLLALSLMFPLASFAHAGKPEIFTGLVDGVGAGGYDVVSYFSGKAMQGKPDLMTEWKGAKWHFSTPENLEAFKASPEKYAPQYGGYCAYGVAQGYAVKGEPEQWSVVDGKLYLNYSADVKGTWSTDIPANISAANGNWPKVLE